MAGFLKPNQQVVDGQVVFDVTSTVGSQTVGQYVVESETTIGEFFDDFLGGKDPNNYNITVNGEQVEEDYLLQAGDDVVVVQSKISAGH